MAIFYQRLSSLWDPFLFAYVSLYERKNCLLRWKWDKVSTWKENNGQPPHAYANSRDMKKLKWVMKIIKFSILILRSGCCAQQLVEGVFF